MPYLRSEAHLTCFAYVEDKFYQSKFMLSQERIYQPPKQEF